MEPICLQARTLSGDDLAVVRALIAAHPDWHRTALSLHLCQWWNWRNGAGRLKDMAARTLLLKLQARGLVELPPPQKRTHRPCAKGPVQFSNAAAIAGGGSHRRQLGVAATGALGTGPYAGVAAAGGSTAQSISLSGFPRRGRPLCTDADYAQLGGFLSLQVRENGLDGGGR